MSKLNDDIKKGLSDLIIQVSSLEPQCEKFQQLNRQFLGVIKRSNHMYFSSRKEIDENVTAMAEKFLLHGFDGQAEQLKAAYDKYLTPNLGESECQNLLNNVKFLLCMSETPTKYFLENPQEFAPKDNQDTEEIDWGAYLTEGIEKWDPNFEESSISTDSDATDEDPPSLNEPQDFLPTPIFENREDTLTVDFRLSRQELLANIQHSWFRLDKVLHKPPSYWREANIGILWEEHLDRQVQGLVDLPKSKVISEYKVIREVLFQLWTVHDSVVFRLEGNSVVVREDVTIASVRSVAFTAFMQVFVSFINLMEELRDFQGYCGVDGVCPCTYRSYANSIKTITNPVYKQLVELEELVRRQETTYTLIMLSDDLSRITEPLFVVQKIHSEVILDFRSKDYLICATTLIGRLHEGLQLSLNKKEQDLRLTIFLDSLFHYFHLINAWLIKDDFCDYSKEFVIEKKNGEWDWTMNFEVREGVPKSGLIGIICEEVLKIGRNLQLLRLLGKFDVVEYSPETIHQEFIRCSLQEMCKFFECKLPEVHEESNFEVNYKFPVLPCEGDTEKVTEMDRLENLVDVSDGFLMKAFQDFFVVQPRQQNSETPILLEKIQRITNKLLPTNNFFEKILHQILRDRFTVSGLMVKNVLIEKFKLDKVLQLLRHLYLFHDDLIFPFYRRLFKKMYYNKNWGNEIWLSSHLQDVLVDHHGDFYEKCRIKVGENWAHSKNPIDFCKLVTIHYVPVWPITIIITNSQLKKYTEIFQVLLKLKWGLYTLNHLSFDQFEPKKKPSKCTRVTKLKYLKFSITNLMISIQHFIFGFIIAKNLRTFELDFEKSNDLNTIRKSHENFIDVTHEMIMVINDKEVGKMGFRALLTSIRILDIMWRNLHNTTVEKLRDCNRIYEMSFEVINPLINPTYVFDY